MDKTDQLINEQPVVFGKAKSLVGIQTQLQNGQNDAIKPAVIFLNAGLIHRVGPNRIYVNLARSLAMQGFIVFRFDLSGIGDSQYPKDNVPYTQRAVIDIQEAMDYLSSKTTVSKFILIGICSGADNAVQVAHSDPRVQGIVYIDGYAIPNLGYYINTYFRKLSDFKGWWRLINGKSDVWGLIKENFTLSNSRESQEPDSQMASPKKLVEMFKDLTARGILFNFIYSDGGSAYYNYRKFLEKKLKSLIAGNLIKVNFLKGTDHLFTLPHHQKTLSDAIINWICDITICPKTETQKVYNL